MVKHSVLCAGLLLTVAVVAEAQRGGIGTFSPAIAARDTVAKCETQPSSILADDERGFILRFGSTADKSDKSSDRVVSAVWDTAGHLRRYSDTRGDLRGPPVPVADHEMRTSIMIDFVKGMALLLNENHGRSIGSAMTTPVEALNSERLGPPKRLLEQLHTQCGAPPS